MNSLQAISDQTNQYNCAHDSGLSSSMDGQTWRASSSLLMSWLVVKTGKKPTTPTLTMGWVACRQLQQRSVLQIAFESGKMTIPADVDNNLHLQLQLPSVYVSCPNSSTSRFTLSELLFVNGYDSPTSTFPWTVTLQNFSVSTVNNSDVTDSKSILEPISLKCTVALNPCTVQVPKQMSIDLAIHVDMNAVVVSLNENQLRLLCNKTNLIADWFLASSSGGSNSPTQQTISSRPRSREGEDFDFDFGVWLQWAMPRFEMSLESSTVSTVVDIEDVTV